MTALGRAQGTVLYDVDLISKEAMEAESWQHPDIADRARRALVALSLLPEGWYVERRDYLIVGKKRGHTFVVRDPHDAAIASGHRVRSACEGEDVAPSVSWGGVSGADADEARAHAVAVLLVSIDAEAHARVGGDH